MSKLLKFKEWVSLPDAARHLSILVGEEVTEADVIRFGLEGHLQISVNFVNYGKGRKGSVIVYSAQQMQRDLDAGVFNPQLRWTTYPADAFPSSHPAGGKEVTALLTLRIDDDRYLPLSDEVVTMAGVWDLAMVGTERLDLEHRFQQLTDGPDVTLDGLDGAFVKVNDHEIWQIQESFDDNEYQSGSSRHGEIVEARIAAGEIAPEDVEAARKNFKTKREAFLAKQKTRPAKERYYPGGLPTDAVFVVRTVAINEFVQTVNGLGTEKPLGKRERETLLSVIAILCKEAKLDYKTAAKTAVFIRDAGEKMGISVGETTIEQHLKKIQNAVETRMK